MMSVNERDLLLRALESIGFRMFNTSNYDELRTIVSNQRKAAFLSNSPQQFEGFTEISLRYKRADKPVKDFNVSQLLWVYPETSKIPLYLFAPEPLPIPRKKIGKSEKFLIGVGLSKASYDGTIYLYVKGENYIDRILEISAQKDWVFYLKTSGRGGTFAGALGDSKVGVVHYLRMANNAYTFSLLQQEAAALSKWHGNLPGVVVPELLLHKQTDFGAYNIIVQPKPDKITLAHTFGKQHLTYLALVSERSVMKGPLNEAPFWKTTGEQIQSFAHIINKHAIDSKKQELPNKLNLKQLLALSDLLIYIWQMLDELPEVFVSYAHNNLSENNCYISGNQLYIHNWEKSHFGLPVLTDLFNFYFQESNLLQKNGEKVVRDLIDKALTLSEAQALVKTFKVDIQFYYLMFLLWRVSADAMYQVQQTWAKPEGQPLLDVWLKVFDSELKRLKAEDDE